MLLQGQTAYGSHPSQDGDGGLCLGRNLFPSLPEDAFDRGPQSRDNFRLVADIRLDNRAELAGRLGISPVDQARLPDAALLFESLLRWGDDALDHLVGEFAFAFWDGAREQLLLGRDVLGLRPLYYHRGKNFFALASMPSGLHALADVPYDFDKEFMVAALRLGSRTGSRTEFKDIHRVEPAHLVRVTRDGVQSRRYWRPSGPPASPAPRDYEEGLRNVMDQAVAAQLRGTGDAVGSQLSGGLDSSTVTATAARLLPAGKVIAFTAVPRAGFKGRTPPGTIANEAGLAAATARLYPNIEHVLVESSGASPLDLLERNFSNMQQPGGNLNSLWGHAIDREAQSRGLNTVLKGYSGNMTISYSGLELLPTLLARGRLLSLMRYALGLARNGMPLKTLGARAIGPCLPAPLWHAIRRLQGKTGLPAHPAIDPYETRIRALSSADNGNYIKSVLAEWGLSVRDPTGDKRVIEYCLATPFDEFLRGGVHRSLARRAFADRLPPEVATWKKRGYQSADWYETLGRARSEIEREIALIAQCDAAADILDIAQLRDAMQSWPEAGWETEPVRARYRSDLLREISIGHFIRRVREAARTRANPSRSE